MKVSYNWLKSMVPITMGPQELASELTFVGLSVEQVTILDKGIKNVVVAEVLEVSDHPTKTKLHICKVNNGKEVLTIVCGAPNVRPNIKVPLAQIGAVLPNGMEISEADKFGIISYGMLCSADELELPDGFDTSGEDGIFILPHDFVVGTDINEALMLDDAILEFELTPNRSDCLSVINIAREVAAITGKKLIVPEILLPDGIGNINDYAKVIVENNEICPRYTGRMVKDVKLGSSPFWMKQRLALSGIRSINNIVDIGNYVMLEMGQPTHAFDYDKLADHTVIVRNAKEGEKLVTLDDQERELESSMLLICDAERAIGVAGVMGGLDTEITADTKDVLIESAYFYPKSIRYTSRKLGLISESSSRFTQGIDMVTCDVASARIAQLMVELAGGTVVNGIIDSYKGEFKNKSVSLALSHLNGTLGIEFTMDHVAGYIASLGFKYDIVEGVIMVEIPSYRQDISIPVDLMEEIARLHGYDKIPCTLPTGKTTEGYKTKSQRTEDVVKAALSGMGYNETISYSFINKNSFDKLNLPAESSLRNTVNIMNPLSDEQGVMRTTMIPSLLAIAERNLSRRNLNLAIYELGRVFLPCGGDLPNEETRLAMLISGSTTACWGMDKVQYDFFYLKGVIESLLDELAITDWYINAEDFPAYMHPGRCGSLYVAGKNIGYMGELHPAVSNNYDLSQKVLVAELDFATMVDMAVEVPSYQSIPKFPGIEQDLALLIKEDICATAVSDLMKKHGGEFLKSVTLFDVYQGDQVENGYKSLAYKLVFQSHERTLTANEVSEAVAVIKEALKNELGVELRS